MGLLSRLYSWNLRRKLEKPVPGLLGSDPTLCCAVKGPRDGSHTGRYALLRVIAPGGYPGAEDHILLARRPDELFRPIYMGFTPWDERAPVLLDFADRPELAVVFHDYLLLWTDDGGRTIRRGPVNPPGLFSPVRFGDHCFRNVDLLGDYLYVTMGTGLYHWLRLKHGPATWHLDLTWRIRVDGSSDRAELLLPPEFPPPATGTHELPVRGGERLLMRESDDSPWIEIAISDVVDQLKALDRSRVAFFGGSATRMMPP